MAKPSLLQLRVLSVYTICMLYEIIMLRQLKSFNKKTQ